MLPILFFCFYIFAGQVASRDMLVRRACELDPDLSFCRHHITNREIRSESEKKHDVFLQWAYVSAKDAQDIEEVDELETSRKKTYSIPDYCTKYAENFKTYCKKGHMEILEGLLAHFCVSYMKNCNVVGKVEKVEETGRKEEVFPTPMPFYSTTSAPKVSYCDGNAEKYKNECEKEGFMPESFCRKYKELCGKLEKVDADTTKSVVDDDTDSLETPDEFEQNQKLESGEKIEKVTPKSEDTEEAEGQGVGTDEVTAYCTNYIENYNFYCVGDMAPEHEKFCNSYKKNCPDRVSMPPLPFALFLFLLTARSDLYRLKQSGSFLGNEGGSERASEGTSSDDKTYLYKGSKKEYCEKFSVNYEYYCKGTIENAEIFTKFCPSYKKACIKDQRPANPFSASKLGQAKPSSSGDSDFPDVDHPTETKKKSGRRQKKIKKRACTADCDERIFPHCTKQCKCDYDYPAVQKFCNPPPLPMFLNTCRLWYYGCPKYEQYHYASQFIYSKAEKGKVLEGPKTQTTFQLLAPSGETLPYKPASYSRVKRETGMVFWPEDDGFLENNSIISNETLEFESNENVDKVIQLKNGTMVNLVAAPPLPKEKNAKDQVLKDSKPPPDLPRIKKTTGGEAVPVYSDSVFSNALAQYNSLTDSRGILHRPRSRSPFTKPGLWEPNPDDPHNRDHANKYYYRPESVNVDWLQGQIAYGAHWAVPAAGVGGTDGFSALHFPSIGTFLNIPDDYD